MRRIHKTISAFIDGRSVPSVSPTNLVTDAIECMKREGSDCVVVLDGRQLVGIFTERDFLNRVTAQQGNPATIRMSSVMTKSPQTLGSHDSIAYAINLMAVRGFRNVPIVDDGSFRAVLTVRDVVSHLSSVFAELEGGESADDSDWVDLGGG